MPPSQAFVTREMYDRVRLAVLGAGFAAAVLVDQLPPWNPLRRAVFYAFTGEQIPSATMWTGAFSVEVAHVP